MKKNIGIVLIISILIGSLVGCTEEKQAEYEKFDGSFFDTFDTVTQVVGFTKTEEEFDEYMEFIHERFKELHKQYDKYNSYKGINNVKTINDKAGIEPVKVDKDLLDMIIFSIEWYEKTGEETNIAFGPVLSLWSKHRDRAEGNPEDASIPSMEELEEANKYTDISKLIVDEENSTVYLEDENMSLDVGAVAKGYAVELVAREVEEKGLKSGIISGGGNIRTIGKPLDGVRTKWGIGLQNPDKEIFGNENSIETVYVNDMSVVTSGDYQRYYEYEGKKIHHIIDPKTLMPGDYYSAVTIVTPDSGVADFLSTSAFLLPFEESLELIESIEDTEAMWIFKDGTIETTEGMKKIMYSEGAHGDD